MLGHNSQQVNHIPSVMTREAQICSVVGLLTSEYRNISACFHNTTPSWTTLAIRILAVVTHQSHSARQHQHSTVRQLHGIVSDITGPLALHRPAGLACLTIQII